MKPQKTERAEPAHLYALPRILADGRRVQPGPDPGYLWGPAPLYLPAQPRRADMSKAETDTSKTEKDMGFATEELGGFALSALIVYLLLVLSALSLLPILMAMALFKYLVG